MSQSSNSELEAETKEAFLSVSEGKDSISVKQFYVLAAKLGGDMSVTKLDAAFKVLDKDNSGAIDYSEFQAWWTSNAGSKSVVGSIRNLLQRSKGLKFIADQFKQKAQPSKDVTTFCLYKDVQTPAMGVLFKADHTPLVDFSNAKGDEAALSFVIRCASPSAGVNVGNLIKSLWAVAAIGMPEISGVKLSVDDMKDGKLVVSLNFSAGTPFVDEASSAVSSFGSSLDGMHVSMQYGWNLRTLAEKWDETLILDLLNVKITATLGQLPIPEGMLESSIGQLEMMAQGGALPVPIDLSPLAEIKNGNLASTVDFTESLDSLIMMVNGMGLVPVDLSKATVGEAVQMALMMGGDALTSVKDHFGTFHEFVKALQPFLVTGVLSLDSVSVQLHQDSTKEDHCFHLEYLNVIDVENYLIFVAHVLKKLDDACSNM